MFEPQYPPTDASRLNDYIYQSLVRISQDMATAQPLLRLDETHVAPDRPRKGDLRLADGTDWNPGSGAGVYWFDGASWNKL